jgi:hypothetical protein
VIASATDTIPANDNFENTELRMVQNPQISVGAEGYCKKTTAAILDQLVAPTIKRIR